MSNITNDIKNSLFTIINNAISTAISNNDLQNKPIPSFEIEIPSERIHGEFSTNIALVCAKVFGMPPIKIAEIIKNNINVKEDIFKKCEVAGPGFINFYLSSNFNTLVIKDILKCGKDYGKSNYGEGKKYNIEFVSANPTGPMHIGNARGGALGDCLACVLNTAGYNVTREFYINDFGNQIEKFGLSLEVRYQQIINNDKTIPIPEECYKGEDITELAQEFIEINKDKYDNVSTQERIKALVEFALPRNIEKMKTDLEKYRINYDVWFKESSLYENGFFEKVMKKLKDNNVTYEKDGALWYKATAHGCKKDEVLIRKNSNPTYFATDIAYHFNKFETRKFDHAINIWGSDHHGHILRLKSALSDVGIDSSKLDIILMQLVHLVKDGETIRMSKRTGKSIGLEDLLCEVDASAARFIFNMRQANSQMEFDLDLAIKQDSQNPVYYVQYAHARICSIIKKLSTKNINASNYDSADFTLLTTPEEAELIFELSLYTDEIIYAAKMYEPSRIMRYVINLASLFHKFYNNCTVNNEDKNLSLARLALCEAVKIVIANVCTMFKISLPEVM